MANSTSWKKIFDDYKILEHNFRGSPFPLSATQIKRSCHHFQETSEKEVRILCKQDSREDRPDIFVKHGLFLLPVKNGYYNIIKGEGFVDIPEIKDTLEDARERNCGGIEDEMVTNATIVKVTAERSDDD